MVEKGFDRKDDDKKVSDSIKKSILSSEVNVEDTNTPNTDTIVGNIPSDEDRGEKKDESEENDVKENSLASSYDLITGLLEAGDWPEKSYNVKRCTGLEVRKGLLLWCREAVYIV